MTRLGRRNVSTWLDRIAPRGCALCGRGLAPGAFPGFCAGCLLGLPGARAPRCATCGLAMPEDTVRCAACRAAPPPFDATLVAADYAPPIDRAVTAMKFGRQLGLARPLGELVAARWLGGWTGAVAAAFGPPTVDCLVPVPLGPARLAQRGFNQALEMARAAAPFIPAPGTRPGAPRRAGVPVRPALLVRPRDTPAQSGLALDERMRNLDGCFRVGAGVAGLRIGLVDDVMTSGSTLAEAARALKSAGAATVVNLVAARTA